VEKEIGTKWDLERMENKGKKRGMEKASWGGSGIFELAMEKKNHFKM